MVSGPAALMPDHRHETAKRTDADGMRLVHSLNDW